MPKILGAQLAASDLWGRSRVFKESQSTSELRDLEVKKNAQNLSLKKCGTDPWIKQ